MGRGKKIQDFRNLNLDPIERNENKKNNKEEKSTLLTKEFIIEVEEKPSKKSKKSENDLLENDTRKSKSKDKKSKKISKKSIKKEKAKSPKTYIEKENDKRKKEEKKNASIVISAFLLTFMCVGIIAGCLVTPTFDVKRIIVSDGNNVTGGEIQRYFSEIKGKNTFLVNIPEIEQQIATHPYIYKAEISRNFPDALEVKYFERKPYAIVKYIESYVFIDKYGSILEIAKENRFPELPIIYGIESDNLVPGEKLEGVANLKFENSAYLLETANHVSFDYTISEINYTDAEEIIILIDELNVEIIYGEIERAILNDKITYLNEILKELKDKKGTLDISSANYSEKVIFTEILK